MGKIIAVDFDGTICSNRYPEIGEPCEKVINYIRRQKEEGAKIILYTCRIGIYLEDAVNFCADQGIIFDAVNKNLPEIIEAFGCDSRKIFANEYLDDRALNPREL